MRTLKHIGASALSHAFAGVLASWAGEASATAYTGGAVSMVVGAHYNTNDVPCNFSKSIDLNTRQDSVAVGGGAACNGDAGSAALYADAATAKVGVKGAALGDALGSTQVNAEVSMIDFWTIIAPAGTALNSTVSIPVTFKLDGSVSPGATYSGVSTSFVGYTFVFGPAYGGPYFSQQGFVTVPGVYAQTFSDQVNFTYTGQAMAAEINLLMSINTLSNGTVDFYNTAAISLALPPGYSAFNSSGVQLFGPVPEAATGALLFLGLGGLVLGGRAKHLRARRAHKAWATAPKSGA